MAPERLELEAVAAGQLILPEPGGRLSDAPHRLAERHLLGLGGELPGSYWAQTAISGRSSGCTAAAGVDPIFAIRRHG